MKTVLLTISRGFIARNLLHNSFYKILREKHRVVILTSAGEDERFRREFAHPNTSFELVNEEAHNLFDRIIFFFHKYLIYNPTVDQKSRWGIVGDPRSPPPFYLVYILKKIIFVPLGKIKILRDFCRYIDLLFFQKKEVRNFTAIIKKHKADLIVLTNVSVDSEAALIKAAKKCNVRTVGIPKSWDNLSKHGFRAKSDILAVWSDFMLGEAEKFQNYQKSQIKIIGVPQFDNYVNPQKIWTRERFCREFGFDQSRRIIFFGSEGKLHPADKEIATILSDFISGNQLVKNCQLLIRPHYGYKDEIKKFDHVIGKSNVVVDSYNKPSRGFRDHWDYSEYFTERFINSIFHSDIIINTYSTLSLDAAAFDKPIIIINFDGRSIKPPAEATERWGEVGYLQALVATQATSMANSEEELKKNINEYLAHPSIKAREREVLRNKFCYKFDGKSGERFANVIVEYINGEQTV